MVRMLPWQDLRSRQRPGTSVKMNVLPSRWNPRHLRALPTLPRHHHVAPPSNVQRSGPCLPRIYRDTPSATGLRGAGGPLSWAREQSPTCSGSPPPHSAAAPCPGPSTSTNSPAPGWFASRETVSRWRPYCLRCPRVGCGDSIRPYDASTIRRHSDRQHHHQSRCRHVSRGPDTLVNEQASLRTGGSEARRPRRPERRRRSATSSSGWSATSHRCRLIAFGCCQPSRRVDFTSKTAISRRRSSTIAEQGVAKHPTQ